MNIKFSLYWNEVNRSCKVASETLVIGCHKIEWKPAFHGIVMQCNRTFTEKSTPDFF